MSISKKRGPTARQLQAEETKQLLINTANCLFNTYGFNAVGVRDIAASAGVSTGAFYHHFTSKEELVLYHSMKISDWFDTLTPDNFAGETCYEKLRDFCTSYLAGIIEKDGPETIHHILSLKKNQSRTSKDLSYFDFTRTARW